ncbi:MAG: hypothetical protein JXA90_02305, partial [Planctomycetes bacterium]|nr:hypothetical protein [Planctomycetota bacterium]
ATGDEDGPESLGRSAEFRYMLTKLAPQGDTRAFAYLSDPFLRRLVGPEVKIGQLRRLAARADLESISAGALLCRVDGRGENPGVDRLVDLGYVAEHALHRDYLIDEDLVARSEAYGTPSDLESLLDLPVDKVTPAERDAYKAYVDSYSAFWRQFFDPIAIRLDALPGGKMELEVFILPLIDSSLYSAVRQILVTRESGVPLRVPQLEPEPVLMLSVNLPDSAWVALNDELDFLYRQFGLPLEIVDEMGPSVHLAVLDGDPVLNLGSGDILGGFGMSVRSGMLRNEAMLMVPVLLSVLTRPCKVLVELHDAERVTAALRRAWIHQEPQRQWDFGVDLTQLGDQDSWILTIDIIGIARLRLGIEVRDGYLIISNIPWTEHGAIRGVRGGHLDSALLQVAPGAGELQLPGLFTSAVEKAREAALQSAAHITPLLLAGAESVENAQAWHRRLFGFTPVHPDHGQYAWQEGVLESARFGSTFRQRQPKHEPGDRDFGWLRRIDDLEVSLQLEEGGLRTRARWKLRAETQRGGGR